MKSDTTRRQTTNEARTVMTGSAATTGAAGTTATFATTALRALALCALATAGACTKREAPPPAAGAPAAQQGAATTGTASAAAAPAPEKVKLNVSCGSVGAEFEQCKKSAQAWAAKTGHSVDFTSTPASSTEMLALYQQIFAAGSSDVDVVRVDVIWPGILGDFFVDLLPSSKRAEEAHFPAMIQNNLRGGKLVAMPLYTDAGLLYYRKDLLEKHGEKVPTTWEELTATAKKIQGAERKAGKKELWGFVWQGKAYEGLTCDALEWIASHGGGTVVDATGAVTVNNPGAAKALTLAASWVGGISPKGVLSYGEEESRAVFQSGNAVFMRNWPYAWALSQSADSPVKGLVGVAALPKGGADGRNAATLGGWQLAVSKFSKHPADAVDLVLHMTGAEQQKRNALDISQHPTVQSVYTDAEVQAANPFLAGLRDTFASAVARPSTVTGAKYNAVSSEFANAVHSVLSGNKKADEALKELEATLNQLGGKGRW